MIEDENSITRRLIKDAGIIEGMRVLDLGCGKGDVSLLLAKVVGPSGEVVGIDRNEKALDIARTRVTSEKLANVEFLTVDLSKPLPEMGIYDVVIGRRVLMYLSNPVDVLLKIAGVLKKNGMIAFQEIDATVSASAIKRFPLHEKVTKWIWNTIEKEGANINIGFTLPSLLQESGFAVGNIKAEANVQGQKSHGSLFTVVSAISPRISAHGVASKTEIDIDTLEQRLKDERIDHSVFISDLSFSILGHKI